MKDLGQVGAVRACQATTPEWAERGHPSYRAERSARPAQLERTTCHACAPPRGARKLPLRPPAGPRTEASVDSTHHPFSAGLTHGTVVATIVDKRADRCCFSSRSVTCRASRANTCSTRPRSASTTVSTAASAGRSSAAAIIARASALTMAKSGPKHGEVITSAVSRECRGQDGGKDPSRREAGGCFVATAQSSSLWQRRQW